MPAACEVRRRHPALLPAGQRLPHRQVPPGPGLPEGARLSAPNNPFGGRILTDANYDKLEASRTSPRTAATRWSSWRLAGWRAKPYVGSVIAGATRPEQVEENAKAADWKLTDEEFKQVDELLTHETADAGGRRV